jgi:hypothetical protein
MVCRKTVLTNELAESTAALQIRLTIVVIIAAWLPVAIRQAVIKRVGDGEDRHALADDTGFVLAGIAIAVPCARSPTNTLTANLGGGALRVFATSQFSCLNRARSEEKGARCAHKARSIKAIQSAHGNPHVRVKTHG